LQSICCNSIVFERDSAALHQSLKFSVSPISYKA